jgi:hypothetical protein
MFIPIVYFIFGIVIYYIESDVIVLIDEHVVIDGTLMNLLNVFPFTVIPVTLLIVIFIKRDLFKLSKKHWLYLYFITLWL